MHGAWTQAAVDLMNKDTQEVTRYNMERRAAWEANGGLAASQTTIIPRPKYSAKDPCPDARARQAAKQRRDIHDAENRRTKNVASAAGQGLCAKCALWQRVRRSCMRCACRVCDDCARPGYLLCNDCYQVHGTAKLMPPRVFELPNTRTMATMCEAWPSCENTTIWGACCDCNRWLCEHCSWPGLPVHCVSCPAVLIPRGGITGLDLRIPAPIRQPDRHACGALIVDIDAFQEQRRRVDEDTKGTGLGRLVAGSWMPGSRVSHGQVARTGRRFAAIPLPAASSSSAPLPAASSSSVAPLPKARPSTSAPLPAATPSSASLPAASSCRPPSPPAEAEEIYLGSPLSLSPESVDWGE